MMLKDSIKPALSLADVVRPQINDILAGACALQVTAREFHSQPILASANLWLVARGLKRTCNRLLLEASRIGDGRGHALNAKKRQSLNAGVCAPAGLIPATGEWLPLPPKLQWIDKAGGALCVTMLELVLNPQQAKWRAERLRGVAVVICKKSNRLVHQIECQRYEAE